MKARKIEIDRILGIGLTKTSALGHDVHIWQISALKGINLLLKNGFSQCPNPDYMQKGEIYVHKPKGRNRLFHIVDF